MFDELYNEFLKLQLTRFYGAKSKIHYLHKEFLKQKFEEMINAAMTRKYKVYMKRKKNLINMDIDDDYQKITVNVIKDSSQRYDSIAKCYEKKDNIHFVMTNEEKFMSPFYWKRVHQLLTSSTSKNDSKYRIYQVKEDNSLSKYVESDTTTGEKYIYILKNHISVVLDQFMDHLV